MYYLVIITYVWFMISVLTIVSLLPVDELNPTILGTVVLLPGLLFFKIGELIWRVAEFISEFLKPYLFKKDI